MSVSPDRTRMKQLRLNDKLFQAVKEACADSASAALEAGAEVNHEGGVFSETSLHIACGRGCMQFVKMLLEAGADPNAKCERGNTPLHEAAFQGRLSVVTHLVEETKVKLRTRNESGYPAYMLAKGQRHHKIADFLKAKTEERAKAASARLSQRREAAASAAAAAAAEGDAAADTVDADLAVQAGAWYAAFSAASEGGAGATTWAQVRAQLDFLKRIITPLEAACDANSGGAPAPPDAVLPSIVPGLTPQDAPRYVPTLSGDWSPPPPPPPPPAAAAAAVPSTAEEAAPSPPTPPPPAAAAEEESGGGAPEAEEPAAKEADAPPSPPPAAPAPVEAAPAAAPAPTPPPPAPAPEAAAPAAPAPAAAPVAGGGGGGGDDDGEAWECDLCCFENEAGSGECLSCGEPKP